MAILLPALVLVSPGSEGVRVESPIDFEEDCLEAIPAVAEVPAAGGSVNVDVLVLLDGVDQPTADAILSRAAQSYARLGLSLVAQYEAPATPEEQGPPDVSFAGSDAQGLIDQAKARYGGARPAGVDVVHVLTTKDIQDGGETAVIGLADCIGGVRYPHRAFSVAEVGLGEGSIGPLRLDVDADAETTTHEVGHLLGAHHHYANCVEGVADGDDPVDVSPCTVMFNAVNPASLWFGQLEGSVVVGHALRYAAP